MATAKKTTTSKKTHKASGGNGKRKPEANDKALTRKKHKKLKHANDRNPYRFVWLSLILLFLSTTLFLSEISYIKFWEKDISLISLPLKSIIDENVGNYCGHFGVIAADIMIRRLFGISALLIPLVFLISSISLVNVKKIRIGHYVYPLIVFTCLCSVFLGCFNGRDVDFFGTGLGGEMGIYISEWLQKYLGIEGTQVLLIILFIAFLWGIAANLCINLISGLYRIIAKSTSKIIGKRYYSPRVIVTEISPYHEHAADDSLRSLIEENSEENSNNNGLENDGNNLSTESENIINGTKDESEEKLDTVLLENGRLAAKITDDYYIYLCPELIVPDKNEIQEEKQCTVDNKENEEEFTIIRKTTESEVSTESANSEKDESDETETIVSNAQETVISVTSDSERDAEESDKNEGERAKDITTGSIKIDDLIISKSETEEEVSDADVNERRLYDPTLELRNYKKPTIDLLKKYDESEILVEEEEVVRNKEQIVNTLATFGISISEIEATVGPTVTLYEIKPAPGVRISKIQNLEKDIALALAALGIRIIAPIPGKGAIGIEVPNKKKATVSMYSVIKSAKFHDSKAELPIALGRTIQNETLVLDLAKMPHLLVAGATGQGKSVGLNAIITSLLYKKHPAELKFVMVDPKRLELTPYSSLSKHFIAQMEGSDDIILTDTTKVIYTLNSICQEMDDRYRLLEDACVKNLKEYNNKFMHRKLNPEKGHRFLPYIVVIVDEFADLIMTAGREIETPVARIAQLARAAGIHMIIATQRPTANIITGTIKANFPARIAFKVLSGLDSRTILDKGGADQLIGRGDMLVYHGSDLTRVQCAFVDTPEVEAITSYIGSQMGYFEPYQLPEFQPESENSRENSATDHQSGPMDPLLVEVARYVVDNQIGSTSKIQRNFEIGFNRAGRIVDQLEKIGVVGKQQGSKPRQVLVSDPVHLEHILDNYR